jgi:hypothetical protein
MSDTTTGQRVAELQPQHTAKCFWCDLTMHKAAHQYIGYHLNWCLRAREGQRAWIHSEEADWLRSIPLSTNTPVAP